MNDSLVVLRTSFFIFCLCFIRHLPSPIFRLLASPPVFSLLFFEVMDQAVNRQRCRWLNNAAFVENERVKQQEVFDFVPARLRPRLGVFLLLTLSCTLFNWAGGWCAGRGAL